MGQMEQDFVNSVINDVNNVPNEYDVADFPSTTYVESASGFSNGQSQNDSPLKPNSEFEQAIYDSYSQKANQARQAIATSQQLANVEIGKALAQAQVDNLNKRQQVYDQMEETLAGREEVLAYPEIVRDFGSLFNAKMSKKYYDDTLATQSAKIDVLKNETANDLELARQAANAVTGYNPLANEPLEQISEWEKQYYSQLDAIQKNAIAANKLKFDRENIPLELAKLAQKDRSDKVDLARALLSARSKVYSADVSRDNSIRQAGTDDLDRAFKERKQAQDAELKTRELNQKDVELGISQFNADTRAVEAATGVAANELKREDNEIAKDRLAFDKSKQAFEERQAIENTRQFNEKLKRGYYDKSASGQTPSKTGEQISSSLTENVNAQVNATRIPVMNVINNGSFAGNREFIAAKQLYTMADTYGSAVPTSEIGIAQTKLRSDANAAMDSAIKSETTYLSEPDKAVFNRRLNNNGILSDSDKPLAKLSFISNRSSSSGTVSLEGDLFNKSQEVFAQMLQSKFDDLTKSQKDELASQLGVDGQIDVLTLLALLQTNPQQMTSSEVMKLINLDRLIDDSVNLPSQNAVSQSTSRTVSLADVYKNGLSQSFTEHINASILNDFVDNENLSSQLRSLFSKKQSFKDTANQLGSLLVQYGYGARVGDYLNRYRSSASFNEWLNWYKANAMSYDNNAAIMLPILGFEQNSVSLARMVATNPKLAESIDSAIANATALSRQRDALASTMNPQTKG